MCMQFCSIINISKIADLSIDFGLNHGLWGLFNREDASVDRSSLLVI